MSGLRHWMKWTGRVARIACLAAVGLLVLAGSTRADLVNYWPFEEGSGINTADVVGGWDGELRPTGNPPVWTDTNLPPVPAGTTYFLEFDGSNDLVNALNYKGITGTNPRSMSAWIRTTSEDMEPIISWGNNSNGQKWTFRVQDGNGPAGTIRVEVNGGYQVGTTYVADGQWHHVAATWEDDGVSTNVNDVRLWVDGALEGVGASQGNTVDTASNANVRIGRAVISGRFFEGGIDDVRIYDHAMTRNEIRALAGVAPDPYFATVQALDPVGYWRLGEPSGDKAFNEGSLGSAADGAYTNGPTLGEPGAVPGSADTSVLLDGADDYVQATGYKGITGTDPRTVSAWIKTTDEGNGPIISWGQNQAGRKWNFRVQDSNGPAGTIRVEVNGGYQVGTTYVADGEWHHVAATWEDDGANANVNDVRLWVDGILQGVGASQGEQIDTASNTDVRIGRGIPTGNYFNGGIDEVQTYDRALSRNEIRALAGLAPDPYYAAVMADTPLGYWRLGEAAGGGNKAFNEGSLGSQVDGSYQNDPTQGQPSLVPTITNPSVRFDSTDDLVSIPDNDAINTGDGPYPQRTMEAWFDVETNTRNRLVIYEEGGTTSGFNMYVQHANDDTHYLRYGAWTDLTGSQVDHFPHRVEIELGTAYHAVSVFDDADDSFVLYLNGAPVSAKVNANIEPIDKHGSNIGIGAKNGGTRYDNGGSSGGPGNYWAGGIDEVAVYDTAVNLRSIQTHYVAGTGDPLGITPGATLGVMLNFDATLDRDGNTTWEDTIGSRPNGAGIDQFDWDLGSPGDVPRVPVQSDFLPKIEAAYQFDGNTAGRGREWDDLAGDPTNQSASFEIVFKPDDYLGTEAVLDVGGGTHGSAIWLDNSVLHFDLIDSDENARAQFDLSELSPTEQASFLHVVGVADLDNDQALIYVDGLLRATEPATGDLATWAGGNATGLGGVAGGIAFNGEPRDNFVGQIALLRLYPSALSPDDVAANFRALRVPEPSAFVVAALALLGVVWYGRRRR